LRAALLSLAVGVALLVLKTTAYFLTGSAAILSDATESVVHQFAIGFALFAVYLASRPPDPSHPFGHGKIEYFSAGFEGAMIMLAAVFICYDAVGKLVTGAEPTTLDVGTVLIGLAAAINLLLGVYLIRVGRRTRSLTLVADGQHVLTDSITSIAVVAGLVLILMTGWTPLDPLVALGVAANILFVGGRLVYRAVRGLMDAADAGLLAVIVEALQAGRQPGWIDVHRLLAHLIGEARSIDLHLTVPRFWDVQRTHAASDELARVVETTYPGPTDLIAHLDPCVDACCRFCAYEPCPIRAHPVVEHRPWTLDRAIGPAAYPPDSESER
jgi:cation diffusion facilitator family transporter